MSAIFSPHSAPVPGLVMLAAFCLPAMAAELLVNGALDSFRPVLRWHGVESVDAIPDQNRSFRVTPLEDDAKARIAQLDAYWAEVSRAVREGDFKAYVATCHPEGVLVSGTKQMSQPLAVALARWEKDFIATRDGKVRGTVEFRFSQRLGDATTAHESGIFRYTSLEPGAQPKYEWIRFEGLLVKRGDTWKILMENQIGPATQADWDALK